VGTHALASYTRLHKYRPSCKLAAKHFLPRRRPLASQEEYLLQLHDLYVEEENKARALKGEAQLPT
jgi:hypothetical protein